MTQNKCSNHHLYAIFMPPDCSKTSSQSESHIGSSYLHNKALVMAASAFRDELVFKTSSLLVELHDWVLPTRRQNGTLSSHLASEKM